MANVYKNNVFKLKIVRLAEMFYIQICIISDSAVTPYLTIVFVL